MSPEGKAALKGNGAQGDRRCFLSSKAQIIQGRLQGAKMEMVRHAPKFGRRWELLKKYIKAPYHIPQLVLHRSQSSDISNSAIDWV